MIKVSFQSSNTLENICEILEKNFTNNKSIENWIDENVPEIEFECMDFPYDLDSFYDCYFKSESEETDSQKVYCFLKKSIKGNSNIVFSVSITDNTLEVIKEIGSIERL